MTLIVIVIVVAIALAAALGFWLRSRPSPTRSATPRTTRTAERFTAVEIHPGSAACEAAHALRGQRFLANKSPALPLAGCVKTRCGCSFAKLSDRREDSRRWGQSGLGAMLFSKAERRKRAGRRDAD